MDRVKSSQLCQLTAGLVVLLVSFAAPHIPLHGSASLHTIMETVATCTALFVGVLGVVRFVARNNWRYLLLGAGFVGTALLDGCHTIVTADSLSRLFPAELPSLAPWSWSASRFYLGGLMLLSWMAGHRSSGARLSPQKSTLVLAAIVSVAASCGIFIAVIPLPRAYYPAHFLGRPQEMIPAIFFAIALIGNWRDRDSRSEPLHSWLILFLVVSVSLQVLVMSRSHRLFDPCFDIAHILKIFSYGCVMMGMIEELQDLYGTSEKRAIQLAASEKDLEKKNQDLAEFVYVASHDLKAPLRGIAHLATWIEDDASNVLPDDSRKHLRQLRGRVERMERLLNDLLAYSRAGQFCDEIVDVDVRDFVLDVSGMVTEAFRFTAIAEIDATQIRTQRAPLEQCLRNLIDNAIKHHHRDNGEVRIRCRNLGTLVEFEVADDGPGIEERFRNRIFRMFQTLHSRDEREGSGMGLALVKRIVENYGGRIRVESEIGVGTSFLFTWPRRLKTIPIDGLTIPDLEA